MDKNTKLLLDIEDEIIKIGWHTHHNDNFCVYVAEKTNEKDNDIPSDNAIKYAKKVLAKYRDMKPKELV